MSVVSVHRGSKVVLSLCVCRLPSRFVEPEFARKFRQWTEVSEEENTKRLNIADGLAYLKTPGHFLPSIEERAKLQRLSQGGDTDQSGASSLKKLHANEIDQLLASEGIPELSTSATISEHDEAGSKREKQGFTGGSEIMTDSEKLLWLVVKYKSAPSLWTFPFTHRQETDSAFTTIMRLCREQIGLKPHLPGLTPIAFRKLKADSGLSSRLFYYKAIHVPKTPEVRIPADSDILEFEWVTRNELFNRLPRSAWMSLRNSIPLD